MTLHTTIFGLGLLYILASDGGLTVRTNGSLAVYPVCDDVIFVEQHITTVVGQLQCPNTTIYICFGVIHHTTTLGLGYIVANDIPPTTTVSIDPYCQQT